ncbi:hypothetical protein ZEAMMB73_Zm00001d021192 [Zea mays]|uniref:Uncharacterized protein n=1 Tax=Zea mays TaxID=4577 RepID=A0A1D6I8V7_MAIZE|nr:hypothetical protein ZEAMMB73_Zm00001d021192 [Zea mays]
MCSGSWSWSSSKKRPSLVVVNLKRQQLQKTPPPTAEAEEVESRSRGHGDGEPEALPGEPVHHRGEREAAGEGQRAPPREPRAAPGPVQDAGRARGRSGSWSCVRLLPLAAC